MRGDPEGELPELLHEGGRVFPLAVVRDGVPRALLGEEPAHDVAVEVGGADVSDVRPPHRGVALAVVELGVYRRARGR